MAPWRESVERWLPGALFVILPYALLFYVGFQRDSVLSGDDFVGGFYHLRGVIGAALREGQLPVWDAHTRCGAPLLASMHGAVLYPATWATAFLDPGIFWTLTAWLHLSLSGAFAFAWLGRGLGLSRWSALAGALLYMLSGFVVLHIHSGHIPHVFAYPWAAAVMWRLERFLGGPTLRRGLFLAAALALMILAGFPQFVFIAGFAVLARLVHFVLADREGRKERAGVALRAAGALAFAGILAAPQLLPTLELVGQTQRAASGDRFDFVSSFSMTPASLASIMAPKGFGDKGPVDSSPFIGIAGLGLAVLGALRSGRGRWLWVGLVLLGLVLALGRHTPVFRVFYEVVPGAGFFRVPARFLLIFVIAAAALAAMGVERLVKGDDTLRRDATVVAGCSLALLVAVGAMGRLWIAAASAVLIVVFVLHRQSILGGNRAAAGLGLLLVAELVGHNSYLKSFPEYQLTLPSNFVEAVKNHPGYPFRIATVTLQQTPVIGMCQLAGLDHVGGYDPMMTRRYTELCNVAREKPAGDLVVAMVLAKPSPIFDLLGARVWIVPGPRQEPPGWKAVGDLSWGVVYENPRAMPRAFLVGRGVAIESPEERLKTLANPTFDPRRVVILESAADASPSGPEDLQGTVQLGPVKDGHYELRTQCASEAYLVLSEGYYPGWTVEVDGAPARILPANHLLQAVRLPAGTHDVRFTYRSRFLGLGFALAAAGLLIPLALMAWRKRSAAK